MTAPSVQGRQRLHAELEERLRLCRSLPTLPSAALRIIELGNDPDVGIAEVADAIALDPALTVKLLKVANSSSYGLRRKTDNLRQALLRLGLNTSMTLALSFSLAPALCKSQEARLNTIGYWRRSLLAATACRAIGKQRGLTSLEELFLAGLLQDIGLLVLDRLIPAEYGPLVAAATHHEQLIEAERKILGADHAEVGTWLLRHWNLPEYLQLAVAGSHDPTVIRTPADLLPIVPCVALSGRFADIWLHPEDPQASVRALEAARQWLGMGEENYHAVQEAIAETLPEVSALFEIELMNPSQIAELVDQAKELLALRNLQLLQKVEVLESHTQTLEQQNRLDPLTGLFNRGHLDVMLAKEFAQASRHGWPLSVAFIDLDHFKDVNDTYGHQAGDAMLISVARLLATQVRQTDVVARYGGDEFMVILPSTGRKVARTMLQRILRMTQREEHALGVGRPIRMTVSLGMATYLDGGYRFQTPEDLVRAADRAVYAAKRGGRNRLVVSPDRSHALR